MGIRWEYLNELHRHQWTTLVASHRLARFKKDIEHLAAANDVLERRWSWLLTGYVALGALLDRRRFAAKVEAYMEEVDAFGKSLQEAADYRMSYGGPDHMSWGTFPDHDQYSDLRKKAIQELRRPFRE